MSFTPPSLTLFQLRLMVAQFPPRAVRLVPMHSQDAPRALWTSNLCAGRVGQLQVPRAWSEEKHSIITAHLSEGALTSLILLSCQAEAQQEACHSPQAAPASGHGGGFCTEGWLCTLSHPLVLKSHLGSPQVHLFSTPQW